MKFKIPIYIFIVFIFSSCNQFKDDASKTVDQNETTKEEETVEIKSVVPPENKKNEDEKLALVPLPPPPKPPAPIPGVSKQTTTKPTPPAFSPELLKAVNNWNKIPKSVFPLGSVTIKDNVEFIAKGTNGEVIARSIKQSGEEVFAVGMIGQDLILSTSKNGRMHGKISIEKTDFKQGVAYLFELRKKQRMEYELRKTAIAKNNQKSPKNNQTSPRNSNIKQIDSGDSLFEDLPIPGDFGHGKFCICNDCREKRLAATESMK